MSKKPDFDLQAAHKFFSAHCFNAAWEYIEKKGRTREDDDTMIRLAQTSLWHWTQRKDAVEKNFSIGYWQLSRVYALAGKADEARGYGELSLKYSDKEDPFSEGYAYEALARAEALAKNPNKAKEYLKKARELAKLVKDPEWRKLLVDDLENMTL